MNGDNGGESMRQHMSFHKLTSICFCLASQAPILYKACIVLMVLKWPEPFYMDLHDLKYIDHFDFLVVLSLP